MGFNDQWWWTETVIKYEEKFRHSEEEVTRAIEKLMGLDKTCKHCKNDTHNQPKIESKPQRPAKNGLIYKRPRK